ncbi:MAG: CoA transferase [Burkholderiaceae bacterium]
MTACAVPASPPLVPAADALAALWRDAGLAADALGRVRLPGAEPVLPSSFAVGTAAQVSIAAAALAAAELGAMRGGPRQEVSVEVLDAALECCGVFTIDGRRPEIWDKLSGLYPCGGDARPGWVRVHANFAHHRDRALGVLGLAPGARTERADVERALRDWSAEDFEDAAARAGAVVAALRSFEQWERHPQAGAVDAAPLVGVARIGDAPPRGLPPLATGAPPLAGVRVLDLTRILAGPVGGRTLAAYGADVMLVNSPALPNIESIVDTSRGKLSAHVDLRTGAGRDDLRLLARDAHVFVQGYRPGGLAALGFSPEALAELAPGIVCVSLSAYGVTGPWGDRRGFDSLVQTATGFNHAEGLADGTGKPRALPMQILDYATGFLIAFGAQLALMRQAREGGSWHVRVSLARTGRWLRTLGRVADGFSAARPDFDARMQRFECGWGELRALPHAAMFSATPARWRRPSMPPGTHAPRWPAVGR